jgi:REP element-mobilizing transposase RayT
MIIGVGREGGRGSGGISPPDLLPLVCRTSSRGSLFKQEAFRIIATIEFHIAKNRVFYTFAPMKNHKQLSFSDKQIQSAKSEHGGSVRGSRKRKRPIGVRSTMHLVLRSSKARGRWSFLRHKQEIQIRLQRFAKKNHIHILSVANVGNHIHLHIRVRSRELFRSFIRGLTSSVMMLVTGFSRWRKAPAGFQFWDQRPYSRIISTWTEFKSLKKYIEVNMWEGLGYPKVVARFLQNPSASGPSSP